MKRIGELNITESEYTLELVEALPKLKIHRVEYQVWKRSVNILCECRVFEAIDDMCVPPEYEIIMTVDSDTNYIFEEFRRK